VGFRRDKECLPVLQCHCIRKKYGKEQENNEDRVIITLSTSIADIAQMLWKLLPKPEKQDVLLNTLNNSLIIFVNWKSPSYLI